MAQLKGRKQMDPMRSKTRGQSAYKGGLVVLTDANSASAAEIFARLVQLEKRGVVVGDVTAGAVMQSINKELTMGG
ncbi:S41 family peptidase, partial [Escherichia coli]|nr:S41 family peptidase [Escherichia coli]